jgi:hypothetical protein
MIEHVHGRRLSELAVANDAHGLKHQQLGRFTVVLSDIRLTFNQIETLTILKDNNCPFHFAYSVLLF